jgi:glycosyltransferase involved in cell wall biosynthesis
MQRNETLARQLGIDSVPVVGYVGSFSYYEGLDLLIRAHRKVIRRCPTARLLLVGDGQQSKALAALVDDLGLGGSVLLTGRIDHGKVLDYYSLIDVFVVPRRPSRVTRIVTPIKPYEAMATGRAVLVSDVEALKEMIVEGETGSTFTAGDEGALASACVELIDDGERRGKMGTEGARWVRQHRNWQTLVGRYVQVYETAKRRQASRFSCRASSR